MKYFIAAASTLLALVSISAAMMIEGEQMTMDEAIVKAGAKDGMSKMYEIMQDEKTVMVELDMLYKLDTYTEMREEMDAMENQTDTSGRRKKRKATSNTNSRWPRARVPYDMSYVFTTSDRQTIMSAIADYHRYTCLRFVPAASTDRNRIRFQNGAGCSSYVGMIGGTQPVSLAPGCRYKGIVIHEMGHAIGFQHEQTRPDRDGYVYIQTQNIQSGLAYNFMRYSPSQVNSYSVPYDYTSVMHYSQTAFSVNGQPTIIAKDRRFQNAMGNRDGFSYRDIQLANTIYGCAAANNCPTTACSQGFRGPDCRCWCDSGNRANPIRICDGTVATVAPSVTTQRPATTAPMSCQDANQYCPQWADYGYCTNSQYITYMTTNCRFSCNACQMTTTTTTTMPTPPIAGCTDNNQYCQVWADNGECSRNPSYMNANCRRSCMVCSTTTTVSDCRDMSSSCPSWVRYCDTPAYSSYLSMNCMKSCGVCTASDAVTDGPVTYQPVVKGNGCQDKDSRCAQQASETMCMINPVIRRKCKASCGLC